LTSACQQWGNQCVPAARCIIEISAQLG